MDKKDEIILQQLELIKNMTKRNLKNTANDFWGAPAAPAAPKQVSEEKKKEASSIDAPPAEKKEEELPPPEKIEDLKAELQGYIGLENIKDEVSDLINLATVHQLRRKNDLPVADLSLHMVFSGNPGTGKTMIARLMSRVYHSLGLLSKGHLVEVDRSGLVAGYVGQTASKTSEVLKKAMGGVLFIDEAYTLSAKKGENDFGQEAIDTILKTMEDNRDDLVVIVAGYDDLMEEFIRSNPGLESRFNRYLHFKDYTLDEMFLIFKMRCEDSFYALAADAEESVKALIEKESQKGGISFGNARGVRNLFEKILMEQANRVAVMETVTRDDLMLIKKEDIEKVIAELSEEK